MDEAFDFSFCQVNSVPDVDQLESPKPMPQVSELRIDDVSDVHIDDVSDSAKNVESKVSSIEDVKIFQVPAPKINSTANTETTDPKTTVLAKSIIIKKPVPRVKVPFEKGYSQMDWLKLTQANPDLAGLKGQSNRRLISMDEVKQHKSEGDLWTVLKGCVYNISPYMKFHPGGVDMLMKAAGKDCTALFNKYHAWVNAEFLLEKCLVGFLDVPT
ncbi:hypothetical protein SUGI_0801850 [Cryptomeria japonica]|uniref:cytochrome b5 domain-containing protein RLF n=1 Tax=Cryptomeria japonica TaxID=3369 RepID=UPI00241486BB|nr:cytochrome b5 domain-containing protein RLF [Cryptomeria japonica]XP_057826848.1 cytochrome b5 domain-containing protein RLF [Cryptomeria japonica]XP_057826849.1 cytochrome b5 domain-containing protein RLF [Cryptomeria japonica]GLJ39294.1 hypothetical protein SUGI_0801850 [Cryptomeria japonica]